MKKIIIIAFVFTMIFTMSACSGKDAGAGEKPIDAKTFAGASDLFPSDSADVNDWMDAKTSAPPAALGFENVTDMLKEQDRLFDLHSDALREDPDLQAYIGYVGPAYLFDYTMVLNPDNKDGQFGDVDTTQGFIQKQGSVYYMERNYIAGKASSSVDIGDAIHHTGVADITEGWAWYEATQERDGILIKIDRIIQEFYPGKMILLSQNLYDSSYYESNTITHSVRFIISAEESYQYVVATKRYSIYDTINPLGIGPEMTTADVREIFEANGYTLHKHGIAENGKLTDLL